jgi:hypothetical protein
VQAQRPGHAFLGDDQLGLQRDQLLGDIAAGAERSAATSTSPRRRLTPTVPPKRLGPMAAM